jgi:glycerophosphoryl diester phosphodiesterase
MPGYSALRQYFHSVTIFAAYRVKNKGHMKIAAHRGFWTTSAEKNSLTAFMRALEGGFGIETDLRDAQGEIVISHDMPRGGEMRLDHFLSLCKNFPDSGPLALNIKADGLQAGVHAALAAHQIDNAFVFDMAVPDALGYLKLKLPTFTRASEYENPPSFYDQAAGIWLDGFHGEWADQALVASWLAYGKSVCMVSPELHGRPHRLAWQAIRAAGLHQQSGFSICTDFPSEAKEFFDAQN